MKKIMFFILIFSFIFSIFLIGKVSSTTPQITINLVGNNSTTNGGPYWLPPNETVVLTSNGYYTNDSRQSKNYMYVNTTVSTGGGHTVTTVLLEWLNNSIHEKFYSMVKKGAYWEYNTSGKISVKKGYNYSINIRANDTGGDTKIIFWNKTVLGNLFARRQVNLGCTDQTSLLFYHPLYIYRQHYNKNIEQNIKDRLHHDQGTDGGVDGNDTGYLILTVPGSSVTMEHCGQYVGGWIDESLCVVPTTVTNVYFHFWWSEKAIVPGWDSTFGYQKGRKDFVSPMNQSKHFNESDSINWKSNVTYNVGDSSYSNNFHLETDLMSITSPPTVTDNSIYEIGVAFHGSGTPLPRPTMISNRSFTSFFIFNVPSNATLQTLDSDGDGINDYNELFVEYTNPFLSDTDNDKVSDYNEVLAGSDPNNNTNTYNITSIAFLYSTTIPDTMSLAGTVFSIIGIAIILSVLFILVYVMYRYKKK